MKICQLSSARQISRRAAGFLTVVSLGLGFSASTNAQNSVSLAWNASAGPGVSGYAVYVGPAGGAFTKRIVAGTNTTVTLTGFAGGETNQVEVTAYNSAGLESPASSVAQFITPSTSQTAPPVTNAPVPTNAIVFAPQPLEITNDGKISITAAGVSSQTYLLQGSTNLMNWTSMFTNSGPGALSYTFTVPAGQGWHFYRTVSVIGAVTPANVALALTNQYFSANAVGYVRVNADHGYTLLANPFDSGNNTVAALLPSVPSGSVLYQYTSGAGYASNVFSNGHWSQAGMLVEPGAGIFLDNPSKTTQKLLFTGTVLQGTVTNLVPVGYSITSPAIPLPTALATLPTAHGDVISCYDGKWITYTNVSGKWVGSSRSAALQINPGNAFFITKQSAVDWVQTYWAEE
jgi:Fibronectin type III domain